MIRAIVVAAILAAAAPATAQSFMPASRPSAESPLLTEFEVARRDKLLAVCGPMFRDDREVTECMVKGVERSVRLWRQAAARPFNDHPPSENRDYHGPGFELPSCGMALAACGDRPSCPWAQQAKELISRAAPCEDK